VDILMGQMKYAFSIQRMDEFQRVVPMPDHTVRCGERCGGILIHEFMRIVVDQLLLIVIYNQTVVHIITPSEPVMAG